MCQSRTLWSSWKRCLQVSLCIWCMHHAREKGSETVRAWVSIFAGLIHSPIPLVIVLRGVSSVTDCEDSKGRVHPSIHPFIVCGWMHTAAGANACGEPGRNVRPSWDRLVLPYWWTVVQGVAIVIQLSTRGTVDSDNWYVALVEKPMGRRYHPSDDGWTPLSQNPC